MDHPAPDDTAFRRLLRMAREQREPQLLLFVFAGAELPDDADAAQRAAYERGEGGAPVPLMALAREPQALEGFAELCAEADAQRADWRLVFIAALGGRAGRPPVEAESARALTSMEDGIRQGRVQAYLVLGRDGRPMELS